MKAFVDTNVFVARLTEDPGRGKVAMGFLDRDYDFCTSILPLMEIRSVMTKKKRVEQDRVEAVLDDIAENVDVYTPEISDQITAYQRQRDSLLYTMDCIFLVLAEDLDATFVTLDGELLDQVASHHQT